MKKNSTILIAVLVFGFLPSFAFGQCEQVMGCANHTLNPNAQFWPAPKIPDWNLTLNLQFHILEEGNKPKVSSSQINTAFQFLQGLFNPKQIYFDRKTDLDYDINSQPNPSRNSCDFITNFQGDNNAINVVISDAQILTSDGSLAKDVIDNYCVINEPSINSLPQDELNWLIAHEIGHLLGLLHTFEDASGITFPNIESYEMNQSDLIGDTPEDPDIGAGCVDQYTCQPATPSCWNLHKNELLDNVMSYTHPACATSLTCEQFDRARYCIANFQPLKGCLTTASQNLVNSSEIPIDEKEAVISQNTIAVWNNPKYVQTVIIESGATLTIQNTTVTFYPTRLIRSNSTGQLFTGNNSLNYAGEAGSIIVKPGGKLIIDHSTLTTMSCYNDFIWMGIYLEGNPAVSQSPSLQPSLEIRNNSLIENARWGVVNASHNEQTLPAANPAYTGGIFNINQTTFKNCVNGIHLLPYSDGTKAYNGKLRLSEFIIDDDYRGTDPIDHIPTGIDINGVEGIKVYGCEFRNDNTSTQWQQQGTAFRANTASFHILPYRNKLGHLSKKTRFEGWEYGIFAENHCLPLFKKKVYDCVFTDNHYGQYYSAMANTFTVGNEFYVPQMPVNNNGNHNYGTYMESSMGFVLENNDYYGVAALSPYPTGNHSLGTVLLNTGEHANTVYRNDYQGLTVAIEAIGNNKKDPASNNGDEGLVLQCNDFTNGPQYSPDFWQDVYVVEESGASIAAGLVGIAKNQGFYLSGGSTGEDLANNLFSHSTGGYTYDYQVSDNASL